MFRYLKQYHNFFKNFLGIRIYFIFLLSIFATFSEGVGIMMFFPLIGSVLNDKGINTYTSDTVTSHLGFLLEYSTGTILTLICGAFILKGVLLFCSSAYYAVLRAKLLKDLKANLLRLTSELEYLQFKEDDSGHHLNLITTQATQCLAGLKLFVQTGVQTTAGFVYLSIALIASAEFSLLILLLTILLFIVFRKLNRYIRVLSLKATDRNSKLSSELINTYNNYKYLKANGLLKLCEANALKHLSLLKSMELKRGLLSALVNSAREPLVVVSMLGTLYLYHSNDPSRIGQLIIASALLYRTMNAFIVVQTSLQGLYEQSGAIESVYKQIAKVNLLEANIENGYTSKNIHAQFKNVSFQHHGESTAAVENLSFELKTGEYCAIIGASGSGKSTLADLLAGVVMPTHGSIDFAQHSPSVSGKRIGYINQDALLFNASILYNLTLRECPTPLEISKAKQALFDVGLCEFAGILDDEQLSHVGESGQNLSGGQRQRLLLARELCRLPSLLILDEATSALDSKSESHVKDCLRRLKGQMTIVVIAHRQATIEIADKIIILESGKIRKIISDKQGHQINENISSILVQ